MSSLPPDDDDRTVIRPAAPPASPPLPSAAPMPTTGPARGAGGPARSDHGNALPEGTLLGEFEITGIVGEGGFGIVYLAWDHSLERRVALKEYMPSALAARTDGTTVNVRSERHRETFEAGRKSFVNEAKLLAQFDHPSLVKVYRFWEANGTAYMVMPFYEGSTMKDQLKAFGAPPDEGWLMDLLGPLTEALAVIHAEHCYHRDIAPDNVILLQGSGRPLLLDFGAARRVIGDMTQALTVILKPGYAPVEQYAEAPGMKQGPWTDVYALAASVYFAIVGKTPPPSVSRLMGDSYVPLAETYAGRYSARFLAAIDKALRVRPEDRTQSIAELRADLGLGAATVDSAVTAMGTPSSAADPLAHAALSPRTAAAPPAAGASARGAGTAAGTGAAAAPGGRKPLILAAAGALLLLVAGGGAWLALRSPAAPAAAATLAAGPGTAAPSPGHGTVAIAPGAAPAPAPQAPAPAPVAATAAPAPFDFRTEMDHVLAAQTAGWQVEATPTRSQLRIGKDRLSFTLTSNRDGEATVWVLGPDGSMMRLFPNGELPRIRLKAGQPMRLPPGDVGIEASEPAGPENFLVIVSASPRQYDFWGGQVQDGYLSLPGGDAAAARLAGRSARLPALVGEAPADCSQARCDEFGAVRFSLEVIR